MTEMNESGFKLFGRFLSDPSIVAAREWIASVSALAEVPAALQPEYEADGKVRKIRRLFWHDVEFWRNWLWNSGVAPLALEMAGPNATLIRHASFLKPAYSGSAIVPHQDQALWPFDYPGALSFWIPFVETTSENGCLQVWPGSHMLGCLPHDAAAGDRWQKGCAVASLGMTPVECPMPAGGLLAWDRYMVHASGPNRTGIDRTGMVLVFADSSARHFYSKDRYHLNQASMEAC